MHKFSSESYQYFEVGALKLPFADNYMHVFNLIHYINKEITNRDIELSAFNTCPTGNKVYFNSAKQKDSCVISVDYANKHGSVLGFPVEAGIADVTLLKEALSTVMHWRFISIWSDRSNIKSQSFVQRLTWNILPEASLNFLN